MKDKNIPNRLINSTSPYLIKHAHNPVDWRPWGPEALETARSENKLIFLSIGYTACHWCNELEKECFDHHDFAEVINPRFVCIKVDREERPDLDRIYMDAAVALQGRGGWPNNVFLTPQLDPVFAIGYQRREAFKSVLIQMEEYWKADPARMSQKGEQMRAALREYLERGGRYESAPPVNLSRMREGMDHEHGGFGNETKFPMTTILEFLLTEGEDDQFLITTLDNMSLGGMFDHVGGGFHRYTTDREWIIPHFEKMLYDNALLAPLYARAALLLDMPDYAISARRTLDFIHTELRNEKGGFLSSLDADSEGEEGKYYLWTMGQFMEVVGDKELAGALGITEEGNMYDIAFEGGGPRRVYTGQSVIRRLDGGDHADALAKLHMARGARPRPTLDDKVVASWHALAVSAFARCGVLLGDEGQVARGEEGAAFILEHMKYAHVWRDGKSTGEADLDDTAYAAMAFWDLFEATGKEKYLAACVEYADYAHKTFAADDGGYFIVGPRDDIIARPRARDDNPLPNGAAVLGMVDRRLAVALNQQRRKDRALGIANHLLGVLGGAGYHSGQAMSLNCEVDSATAQVVYSFAKNEGNRLDWLQAGYGRRWGVVRIPLGASSLDSGLRDGIDIHEVTRAYVCVDGACLPPVMTPGELKEQLEGIR